MWRKNTRGGGFHDIDRLISLLEENILGRHAEKPSMSISNVDDSLGLMTSGSRPSDITKGIFQGGTPIEFRDSADPPGTFLVGLMITLGDLFVRLCGGLKNLGRCLWLKIHGSLYFCNMNSCTMSL